MARKRRKKKKDESLIGGLLFLFVGLPVLVFLATFALAALVVGVIVVAAYLIGGVINLIYEEKTRHKLFRNSDENTHASTLIPRCLSVDEMTGADYEQYVAQDATQDELLDAIFYLEYQKSKRSIPHTNAD